MKQNKNLTSELKIALEKWANENLEAIGIYKNKFPEYDKLIKQSIDQLRSIYSDKAIDVFLRTKDNRKIESPDGFAKVTGPCGDTMQIFLKMKNDIIMDSSFQTDGCKPSIASGGMLAEMIKGKSIDEVNEYTQQNVLDALDGLPEENKHCALLAILTLKEAIKNLNKKTNENS